MAETSVQKQRNESKDIEKRMLAAFRKFPLKEQQARLKIAEITLESQEQDELKLSKFQEQGMTMEEAQEKLKQDREKELDEALAAWSKPKEPTEKEQLLHELSTLCDDLEDNAGELDFFSTAIDKIIFTEDVYGCGYLFSLLNKQADSLRKIRERIYEVNESLGKTN